MRSNKQRPTPCTHSSVLHIQNVLKTEPIPLYMHWMCCCMPFLVIGVSSWSYVEAAEAINTTEGQWVFAVHGTFRVMQCCRADPIECPWSGTYVHVCRWSARVISSVYTRIGWESEHTALRHMRPWIWYIFHITVGYDTLQQSMHCPSHYKRDAADSSLPM